MRYQLSAPTLLLFDLDGTLIDSEYPIAKITVDVARSENCAVDLRTAFCTYGGMSFKDRFNAIASSHGREFTPEKLAELHKQYQARKEMLYGDSKIEMIKGARSLVQRLAKQPDLFTLGLASSNVCARSKKVITNIGLAHLFGSRIYGSDLVDGRKKPDPAIYNRAMQGHDPKRVGIIEDSLPGVIAAKAAGAFVIAHVDSRHGICKNRNEEYMDSGADVIVNDYRHFESKVQKSWQYWPGLSIAKAA